MCFIILVHNQMRAYTDWGSIWSDNKLYQLSRCMKRLRKRVEATLLFFLAWDKQPTNRRIGVSKQCVLFIFISFLSWHRLGAYRLKMLSHTSEQHKQLSASRFDTVVQTVPSLCLILILYLSLFSHLRRKSSLHYMQYNTL